MIKNKLPEIKKSIRNFLTDEDGKLSKKDLTKITAGVMAVGLGLSGLADHDSANAACGHASHSNHSSSCGCC